MAYQPEQGRDHQKKFRKRNGKEERKRKRETTGDNGRQRSGHRFWIREPVYREEKIYRTLQRKTV